jgi:selenocysteine lyase/cysteine desulfurase
MANAALKQILTWQVAEIATTLSALTDEIAQRATALGLDVVPAQLRAGHLLGIRFPEGVPDGLLDRLAQNKIYVSVRGNSIRISPHLYNTTEDIDKLFSVLG